MFKVCVCQRDMQFGRETVNDYNIRLIRDTSEEKRQMASNTAFYITVCMYAIL